jgi:hypothetical protein
MSKNELIFFSDDTDLNLHDYSQLLTLLRLVEGLQKQI